MLTMLALGYLGSTELLTPTNVLLYQLIWMIPGFLVTEWTRARIMRSAIPGACGSGDGFILPFTPGGDCIPCWISMPEFVCFAHKNKCPPTNLHNFIK